MKILVEKAAARSLAPDRPRLSLARVLAAPAERVWEAWVRPEQMVRWLGPAEFPASAMEADVRVGGAWRACLSARDGSDVLWQGGRYLDVDPPDLLRFTFAWTSPNHEDAGIETIVTVRFERLDAQHTRLTLLQEGLPSEQSLAGHAHGWGSTLERLDGHLRARPALGHVLEPPAPGASA